MISFLGIQAAPQLPPARNPTLKRNMLLGVIDEGHMKLISRVMDMQCYVPTYLGLLVPYHLSAPPAGFSLDPR